MASDSTVPATADDTLAPMASVGTMKAVTLTKPAIINDVLFKAGDVVHVGSDEILKAGYKAADRSVTRTDVERVAGDHESQMGTIADIAALTFVQFCGLVNAIASATTLDDVRKSPAFTGFQAQASVFADAVSRGDVKFPFQAKGVNKVITDLSARGTATAKALADK